MALSAMPARIAPTARIPIYPAEWREFRGKTQEQLASDLGVAGMTISRWERKTTDLSSDVMAAIAEALQIHPQDLYRRPGDESIDAMLREAGPENRRHVLMEAALVGAPEEIKRHVLAVVDALIQAGGKS